MWVLEEVSADIDVGIWRVETREHVNNGQQQRAGPEGSLLIVKFLACHTIQLMLSLPLSLSISFFLSLYLLFFCVSLVIHSTHSPRILRLLAGSASQLENTELSNGIVQDDPEIIALQNDKVDILLHCIKSSTRDAAWIYGQVLCQIIRDLVPPNEILTKVIKEFLAINQPHGDVIATIVYQVSSSQICCCPASWPAGQLVKAHKVKTSQ